MSDEFIVMVKAKGEYSFYTSTEPDMWVIDNAGYAQAFIDAGYDLSYVPDDHERSDTGVLSLSNIDLFLKRIESKKVNVELLKELLASCLPTDDWWSIEQYIPRLIYDFDASTYCSYHEQHIFDKFIPNVWVKNEYPFKDLPHTYKYWIVNGEDLLEKEWQT
jgi:hypothetical protein